jgi:ABC-type antimicrobial peptide transport system permease subunit
LVAQEGSRSVLTGLGDPARVIRSQVSEGYFEVFGARPSLGRLLAPSDDGERVVVLSHGFWQERFGGDPAVLGRVLTLDSIGYEIVGVLSEDFLAPEALPAEGAVAWVPLGLSVGEPDRRSFGLGVVGRRRPQSTAQDGRAHVERIIQETYGGEDGPNFIAGAMVVELKEATVGTLGGTLGLALASVAILLLIGCVNVAGLLLARGTERRSEMAIRSALGAGRRRIVGQLMAESLFTGLAGGGLGAALAYGAVEAFRRWTPGGIPRLGEVTVDLRVLGFTLAVSLGTALVFGLLPALKAAREAGGPIAGMGLRTTQGRRTGLMRSGLILVETTLAILLSVGRDSWSMS